MLKRVSSLTFAASIALAPHALRLLIILPALFLQTACSSSFLKADNSKELLKTDDADKAYHVTELPPEAQTVDSGYYVRLPGPAPDPEGLKHLNESPAPAPGEPPPAPTPTPVVAKSSRTRPGRNRNKPLVGKNAKKLPPPEASVVVVSPGREKAAREPLMEDAEGFIGRRPKVDPFRVGEKVVMEASYFGVAAGDLTFEVRPFVQVNGRKSYHFTGTAISTSVFAVFYSIEDWVETLVDFETLVPYNYALHVKETKQLRESRAVFDWTRMKASFWDKKINTNKKVDDKKEEWDIPTYSQDVFSAPFYLRNFTLKVGKKIAFRVAHEGTNLILTAEVLRKEHIATPAGEFDTVVLKPTIQLNGEFKPVGDIFLWFTDDDRKFLVRMESKIKIGKIVAVAKVVEPGQ